MKLLYGNDGNCQGATVALCDAINFDLIKKVTSFDARRPMYGTGPAAARSRAVVSRT